jgi:hypothetical protein
MVDHFLVPPLAPRRLALPFYCKVFDTIIVFCRLQYILVVLTLDGSNPLVCNGTRRTGVVALLARECTKQGRQGHDLI